MPEKIWAKEAVPPACPPAWQVDELHTGFKNIDPDRALERLMRKWLEEEARKLARKEKAPRELARVLRFKKPRGT